MHTGRYSHAHGVYVSSSDAYRQVLERRHEADALAVRLAAAGYRNAHFGKYINGYGKVAPRRVPTGWSRWYTLADSGGKDFFSVSDQGEVKRIKRSKHNEDRLMAHRAASWIRAREGESAPWFVNLSFHGPHGPYFPSERHRHDYDGVKLRKPPSYAEKDVSDKPAYVRREEWTAAERDDARKRWEGTLEELQDVDDGVEEVFRALSGTGQLANTFVLYCTDNGFLFGEHRLAKKQVPYEESVGVPFLLCGPGVQRGAVRRQLVSQLDLTATICDLAGADASGVDGRSLRPLFATGDAPGWRKRLLIEHPGSGWYMLREDRWAYIEYATGERELYDLETDPYQLENVYGQHSELEAKLATRLKALKGCAADTCRSAEGP